MAGYLLLNLGMKRLSLTLRDKLFNMTCVRRISPFKSIQIFYSHLALV